MRIKAYVNYNEEHKTHYYRYFDVIDELPSDVYNGETILSINEVSLDAEQGSDAVYNYDFYCINTKDSEDADNAYYVATLKRIIDGCNGEHDGSKYYIDKCYVNDDSYSSYEAGEYDDMFFNSYEEAVNYAKENIYLLDSNEVFSICIVEDEDE